MKLTAIAGLSLLGALALGVTEAHAQVALPFAESFTDVPALTANGWFQQNNSTPVGTAPNWSQGATFNAQDVEGGYAGVNYNSVAGANTISNWLLTPELELDNGVVVGFWTRTVDGPQFPDRLEVRLSVAGASTNVGATNTSVGDFTTLLLTVNPDLTTTDYPSAWTRYSVTLTGLAGATTGRVGFRYFVTDGGPNGTNSDAIGIDTLVVAVPECGNGAVEGDEECDDGNDADGDACSNACVAAVCGDEVVTTNEGCDDGNDVPFDGCKAGCVAPDLVCDPEGDSATQNADPTPSISLNCNTAGDATFWRIFDLSSYPAAELAGVTASILDVVTATTVAYRATAYRLEGDFLLANLTELASVDVDLAAAAEPQQVEFLFDAPVDVSTATGLAIAVGPVDAAAASDTEHANMGFNELPQTGPTYVTAPECGAQFVEPRDLASFGAPFDTYSVVMSLELRCGTCGDGTVDDATGGEECDDGNDVAGDGCENDCTVTVVDPACGDGTLDAGEACDDGNTDDGDGCESDCTVTVVGPACGDGTLDAGEACDDGNTDDGDGCESDCTVTPTEGTCGDGTVDDGEACDDGNTEDGDGCESDCTETGGGGDTGGEDAGGGCCSTSRNDGPAGMLLGLGVLGLVLRRRKRAA